MSFCRCWSPFVTLSACALVLIQGATFNSAEAQEDSTVVMLRALQRRLDSLERVIEAMRVSQGDTTEAVDELAALRAAARAVTGEISPDQTPPQAQSRTRNLSVLNPEISVTGDIVGSMAAASQETAVFSATPREFEFSFQAALDPYTRTKVFVTREEDFEIAGSGHGTDGAVEEEPHGFAIEEGYMYWVGLPGGFGAKVGKFRQEIGLYNRWHTHALAEVERPLAATTFLGEDGLIQTGASIVLPTFTVGSATQTVTFEFTRGNNDVLFQGGSQMSYLGSVQNFWNVSDATYVQFGATGVYGRNGEVDLRSRLWSVDFSLRWRPAGSVNDLNIKSEWYFLEQDTSTESLSGDGGYLQANYQLDRRWIVGARADYVNFADGDPNVFQFAPSLTWWQSEWVRVRLQYNMLRPTGGAANHTLLLQFVWAMGPDKHETY